MNPAVEELRRALDAATRRRNHLLRELQNLRSLCGHEHTRTTMEERLYTNEPLPKTTRTVCEDCGMVLSELKES